MSTQSLHVLLYGDTVVLCGLAASLAPYAHFEVTTLDRPAATERDLAALQPDVVIFDIGAVRPAFRYELVEKLPDLVLVGIDPGSNRALVWSGQQVRQLSTGDLVRLIERQTPILSSP